MEREISAAALAVAASEPALRDKKGTLARPLAALKNKRFHSALLFVMKTARDNNEGIGRDLVNKPVLPIYPA